MKEITVKELMAFADESRFKNAIEFSKKYNAVMDEVKTIKERKESAAAKIEELNKELSNIVTDVDEILNPLKRKKILDANRKLREQLEEEEMFLNLDVDSYKNKKLDELIPLAELVKKDNFKLNNDRSDLFKRLREEHTYKENIVTSTHNNIQSRMGTVAQKLLVDKDRRVNPIKKETGKREDVFRIINGKQVKVGERIVPY